MVVAIALGGFADRRGAATEPQHAALVRVIVTGSPQVPSMAAVPLNSRRFVDASWFRC
jgi:hypothetical protein